MYSIASCLRHLLVSAALSASILPAFAQRGQFDTVGSAGGDPADGYFLTGYYESYQAGAVWKHGTISLQKSFKARFSYSCTALYVPQGDGLALVIQTDGPGAVGADGGGLGYQGLHAVASVVQTSGNRVGLSIDGDPASAKASPATLVGAYNIVGEEAVAYDAASHVLSMNGTVMVDGVPYLVSDSKVIDLASALGRDTATIGVTGGSGSWNAWEYVDQWSLVQVP